jgi:hypothetical protein
MDLPAVRALITLPDEELIPSPELFLHRSFLHGQAHVGRVLVHGLRLIEATGRREEASRLWASIYLHDLARRHDGGCRRHGKDAWARLLDLPDVQARFLRGGVTRADYAAIEYAVTVHCVGEPDPAHPHHRLAALLKDADGLDRVRLGDLDPGRLRHPAAPAMVDFAQRLFDDTNGRLKTGTGYFTRLWPAALAALGSY